MADFCKQCSERTFGRDFGDLANLLPQEMYGPDVGASALCEGCGYTVVDINGACIAEDCSCRREEK